MLQMWSNILMFKSEINFKESVLTTRLRDVCLLLNTEQRGNCPFTDFVLFCGVVISYLAKRTKIRLQLNLIHM